MHTCRIHRNWHFHCQIIWQVGNGALVVDHARFDGSVLVVQDAGDDCHAALAGGTEPGIWQRFLPRQDILDKTV